MALLAIGVIAFTVISVFGPHANRDAFFTETLYSVLNLLAAALIALRAYRVATDRWAWALIAVGMTCSAIGDVVYQVWVPDGKSLSAADPEYLAFYPFVYLGLLLLMRARLASVPIPIRLDPPGMRFGHGRAGRGAAGGTPPRGRHSRTANRSGRPALPVGRPGPVGPGRRNVANNSLAQRIPVGPALLRG